jgi:hypothetical protein
MRVHSADLLQCRFAVSPLTETTDALRSLVRPAPEAYHLTWQRRVRPRLPGLRLEPLLAILSWSGYQRDFLAPAPDSPFTEVEAELDRVRATSPARDSRIASATNWARIWPRVAPSARRSPISERRSSTEMTMMLATPIAPTKSATAPRPRNRVSRAPLAAAAAVSAAEGWETLTWLGFSGLAWAPSRLSTRVVAAWSSWVVRT